MLLHANRISLAYGHNTILNQITLHLADGEHVGLVGANGVGKSTLMKVLAGTATPDSGTVQLAPSVRLGYLPQADQLLDAETLIDAYKHDLPGDHETHKAALIGSGFFRYPELSTPAAGLSAGQRRKLQLARLIAQQANVLLLDEPTNHLSFDLLEAFEDALHDFGGAIIAVSHDRRFLAAFGGRVIAL